MKAERDFFILHPSSFILLLILLLSAGPAAAQSSSPAYWQYDAAGRLHRLTPADVNGDGIDEFIVVAVKANEQVDVTLVGADGRPQWTHSVQEPVFQVAAVNVDGRAQPQKEILIGAQEHLILLDHQGQEMWQRWLSSPPVVVAAIDANNDSQEEIAVGLQRGPLRLYDGRGVFLRQYPAESTLLTDDARPLLQIGDVDQDGRLETIYSFADPRGFSQVAVIDNNGQALWTHLVAGVVTSLTLLESDEERVTSNESGATQSSSLVTQPSIYVAVGTQVGISRGRLHLLDAQGREQWYRTPNKPVTALAAAQLSEGPALLVGTAAGTVLAYDLDGRRYWSRPYAPQADRPIRFISASTSPVILTVTLAPPAASTNEPADTLLLDSQGRVLAAYETADAAGLTRLVDINRDGYSELLLASFGTLELLDPGIGVSVNTAAWDYRLGAQPRAALVADLDGDGQEELLVGTDDGRLHLLKNETNQATPQWILDLGGVISHLATVQESPDDPAQIVVTHNRTLVGADGLETVEGAVTVLHRDGRILASATEPATLSALRVGDINNSGRPELLVGTTGGQVIAYSIEGEEFWRATVNGGVEAILLLDGDQDTRPEVFAASQAHEIHRFNNKGTSPVRLAFLLQDIDSLTPLATAGEPAETLLIVVGEDQARALDWRGATLWEHPLNGRAAVVVAADNSILIATDESELLRLGPSNNLLWTLSNLGRITSLYWGDLDGDARPDVAIGNREGQVHLCNGDGRRCWDTLNLPSGSGVFHLAALRQTNEPRAELAVVADNGIVQLFRAQPNRPPLLIDPQVNVGPGRYSFSVSAIDVESDDVAITLELFDGQSQTWMAQEQQVLANGNGSLFWSLDSPGGDQPVRYHFLYDDGAHQGQVEPSLGPAPLPPEPFLSGGAAGALVLAVIGAVVALVAMRQAQAPPARARGFYRRLRQQPAATLELLAEAYHRTGGSPDFLLNLATQARQDNHPILAGLTDGLFLLADRPRAGLPLIVSALEEAQAVARPWHGLEQWAQGYSTALALLEAPSITELCLLQPRLAQLDATQPPADSSPNRQVVGSKWQVAGGRWQVAGDNQNPQSKIQNPARTLLALLPALNSLRDSQRVDQVEDRLVYLNEAAGLLQQLQKQGPGRPTEIDHRVVAAVVTRWQGLTRAEIEELRGRARLVVNLKTRRLVPAASTEVALEIRNDGRAPAENILVLAENNPAYQIATLEQSIPFLPPGRARLVSFTIAPQVDDHFRMAFKVTHSDRHAAHHELAFADLVHILPAERPFNPIPNPYLPGTPLRRNSGIFFGREELFHFIADNANRLSQRNVLILIGQRRTGKTSALLRVADHLPANVLPVYVDCQSLGVAPGMAALLHDLAWLVADALAARGLDLSPPDPAEWQDNPTGRFQRHFLPAARALLPPETTLLLIFDEFEALENLVNDAVLPPTLFTYLRHLMQHGEGLSFVFVGTRRLEEMSTDYWSVLFNVALYRHIGYLSEADASRLIREPVSPHLVYDDLAVDKILRVTAGHPYFLQLVCYTLVNRANSQRSVYVTISDVNAALDEMLRLGEVHFAYLWQRSTQTERVLLTIISHLLDHDLPFRPADLEPHLAQYRLSLTPAEVTAGLNRLVEREILQESGRGTAALYELRLGLVGLWVAQNKSLSRLLKTE
ncbi:MAG: AAA family ATPase [Chloroflexota bacterium]